MHTISLTRAWHLESSSSNCLAAVRRFNSPTGLQPEQLIWIELDLQTDCQLMQVELNGNSLPIINNRLRWQIESLLPNNQLRIEVCTPNQLAESSETAKRLLDMSLWVKAELQIA
jgi:hypothetical protein